MFNTVSINMEKINSQAQTVNRFKVVEGEAAVDQLTLIAGKGARGEVYHVASGRAIVMRDLLARLLREAGIDPAVVREAPQRPTRMGTDVPSIYADITKTRALADD